MVVLSEVEVVQARQGHGKPVREMDRLLCGATRGNMDIYRGLRDVKDRGELEPGEPTWQPPTATSHRIATVRQRGQRPPTAWSNMSHAQMLSLYRHIIRNARVYPSKSRDRVLKEIRVEVRNCLVRRWHCRC